MENKVFSSVKLAKYILPTASDWTLEHVAAALEI